MLGEKTVLDRLGSSETVTFFFVEMVLGWYPTFFEGLVHEPRLVWRHDPVLIALEKYNRTIQFLAVINGRALFVSRQRIGIGADELI